MNKIIIFLILSVLLLAISVKAMTPLTEDDLSVVSNPLSLTINLEQINMTSNKPYADDYFDGLNQLSPISSGLRFHFDINLFEDPDETVERYAFNLFSSFSWLKGNNTFNDVQIVIIDPATGKSYTELLTEDSISEDIQTASIYWNFYTKIINAEDANRYYSNPQVTGKPSMLYPIDHTQSSNDPYTYVIKAGTIDMRDTYIDNKSTTIQSGSWVNIKTR